MLNQLFWLIEIFASSDRPPYLRDRWKQKAEQTNFLDGKIYSAPAISNAQLYRLICGVTPFDSMQAKYSNSVSSSL